jgi:hypothetical protein
MDWAKIPRVGVGSLIGHCSGLNMLRSLACDDMYSLMMSIRLVVFERREEENKGSIDRHNVCPAPSKTCALGVASHLHLPAINIDCLNSDHRCHQNATSHS